ncbi:MepB family protein [Kaistella flava (ex Peng et al. 2021)]|uniref:MepB family protein n=1 Tax=Kaistella flava (ex Peng et al. 2021) TaxID=2038776 RepID=A0A7M2Y4Y5_9FLAO|nr:MepB family protein [Kaistella flava (ex Peng et al. 2021)]QOW09180.1 MepB family protein [Kaistella flava (ex Peng et al. 2021)]
MTLKKTPFPDLESIDELVFKPCSFSLKNIQPESESQEYAAQIFQLNEYKVLFRKAKITPTKTGQFVTLWKRNEKGITEPFDITDKLNLYLIATKTPTNFGIFIFPKKVLHENKVLSDHKRDGKRGIRVYPSWDETTSKQAQKTQVWQTEYFLDLSDTEQIDLNRAKNLLRMEQIDGLVR